MARRARRNSGRKQRGEEETPGSPGEARGANHFNPEEVEKVVNRIEVLKKELETEKSEYMLRCKDIRSDVKDIYDEAKDKGIGKPALKAKIKERELRKKVTNCRSDLEAEQIDMFDQISQSLGDRYEETPQQAFVPPPTAERPFSQA